MDMQFIGILGLLPFLLFSSGNEIPQDVLALIEPGMGLEILEQKSDPASLEKLILSGPEGDDAPVGGVRRSPNSTSWGEHRSGPAAARIDEKPLCETETS